MVGVKIWCWQCKSGFRTSYKRVSSFAYTPAMCPCATRFEIVGLR